MTEPLTRRRLLKTAGAACGVAALVRAGAPMADWANTLDANEFHKHYKSLSEEEMSALLRRLEAEARQKFGVDVKMTALKPEQGVGFAYALNLSTCQGCRQCTAACRKENNLDRETNNAYIRVFEMEQGGIDLSKANALYNHPVPQPGKFYMPVQCHHCDNSPCTKVCPVRATWKEPDGIVVVDYDWCIGCRCCEAACPYHARRFNWSDPTVPREEINPEQDYLSNRMRRRGVMEKCTFCLHRTRAGKLPACLESCPAGSRVFGNYLDPDSNIRWMLENKRVYVLKEELGTKPRFFYYFDK